MKVVMEKVQEEASKKVQETKGKLKEVRRANQTQEAQGCDRGDDDKKGMPPVRVAAHVRG
eukprot:1175876-Prorocentrum_minimum.AAC.1